MKTDLLWGVSKGRKFYLWISPSIICSSLRLAHKADAIDPLLVLTGMIKDALKWGGG